MNKKDLLHQAIEELTHLEKTAPEYRWENRAIGQGHYFTDLWDCIQDALAFSKKRPHLRETLLIEQFKPERNPLLVIQNGTICTATPPRDEPRTEELDQEKRLKANELIVTRIRTFFDGPNFVQADLTRDAFYKILHDSKLEANAHQEQTQ